MRLSGRPSPGLKHIDDPLRDDPVASINETCAGCGDCGEVAEAAVLRPSFHQADVVTTPTASERRRARCAERWIGALQRWRRRGRLSFEAAPRDEEGLALDGALRTIESFAKAAA